MSSTRYGARAGGSPDAAPCTPAGRSTRPWSITSSDTAASAPSGSRPSCSSRSSTPRSSSPPAYDDGTPEAEPSPPSEPSGTGLTRCQAEAALASQPFSRLLGTRVAGFGNGRATLQLLATEELRQQDGHVHGGVLSYLADNAMAFAAGTELGPAVLTAGMTIEYLRPARAAVLRATGVVVHAGRRQVTCRCDVVAVDAAGDTSLCATAQGRARLAPS